MKKTPGVAAPEAPLRLRINDLAAGGRGVARAPDGRVVFVAGALPGELVQAQVTRARRQYYQACTLAVLEPAGSRVAPACELYGRCGGCDLMHLAVEAQNQAKAAWVAAALQRLGRPPQAELIASPRSLGYRNRLRLQVQGGRLGFFAPDSHDLVELARCPVAAPAINRLLPSLADELRGLKDRQLTGVELLAGQGTDSPVFLTLRLARGTRLSPGRHNRLQGLAHRAGAAGARVAVGGRVRSWPLDPQHGVVYHEGPPAMWAFPGVFCQVNFGLNRRLVQVVRSAVREAEPGAVLDLYAGSGNFTFPLAADGRQVVAVEAAGAAVDAARFHGRRSGLASRVRLVLGDAARAARDLAGEGEPLAAVVLDPPRAGAKPVMPALAELRPGRVVYVSCHAAALARDAGMLVRAGYTMERLWVLDQFPQTGHVESVLVLRRE